MAEKKPETATSAPKATPAEVLATALKAVDPKAMGAVESALGTLCKVHDDIAKLCAQGHPKHAGHNQAFERARKFLHEAHGGAAQALDKIKGFFTLHEEAKKLYAKAEKEKAKQ